MLNTQADLIDIDNAQLVELMSNEIILIDVRREDEWLDTGVIKGSLLNTFFDSQGQYDSSYWLSELSSYMAPDTPIILICHSGYRSNKVGEWLSEQLGIKTVYNVKDGIVEWIDDGNETVDYQPGSNSASN